MVEKVKAYAKGQIVIPKELREKYSIRPGTELKIFDSGGVIHLIPKVKDPIKAACGYLPGKPSLTRELLKHRKQDFPR